jgi:hypothetical protein
MKSPIWRRRQAAWEAGEPLSAAARRGRAFLRRLGIVVALAAMLCGGYALGVSDKEERLNPFASDPLVVWAGESFYSKREFVGWLAEHGFDPQRWLERHPAIAARLDAEAPEASVQTAT